MTKIMVDLPTSKEVPVGPGWEGCIGSWTAGDNGITAWRCDGEEFVIHDPDGFEHPVGYVREYAAALLAACAAIEQSVEE